jgi:hypothetical protein
MSEPKTDFNSWNSAIETECKRLLMVMALSSSQVASALNLKFGTHFTRNAIIGKSHRMGWSFTRKGSAAPTFTTPKLKVTKKRAPFKPKAKPEQPTTNPQIVYTLRPVISGAAEAIVALRSGECKYGIGDTHAPDFRFCSVPTGDVTRQYCAEHHAICHPRLIIKRAA